MTLIIAQSMFDEAMEMYLGWCPYCRGFTRDETEPGARGYDCPECGERGVLGAEEAFLQGEFSIGFTGRER
jgi:hypothetical protein